MSIFRKMINRFKKRFEDWLEWQHAKDWANTYHPAWVEIVKRTQNEEVREYYKNMILGAYRGGGYV